VANGDERFTRYLENLLFTGTLTTRH